MNANQKPVDVDAIAQEISSCIAQLLAVPPDEVRRDVDIGEYGVSSLMFAIIADKVATKFNLVLPSLSQYTELATIEEIAASLGALEGDA